MPGVAREWRPASNGGVAFCPDKTADEMMNETVNANRAVLQNAAREAQANTLRHLKAYIANREKAFEAFDRMDPDSQPARDARARLEKARRDYETFAASIGETSEDPPTA
jgi:hypothetical protein